VGTVIGLALGYYLGVKAGPGGLEELLDAWKTISTSAEVRDMVSGGASVMRDLLQQGGSLVAGRLAGSEGPLSRAA
jgi:hypothetical protein